MLIKDLSIVTDAVKSYLPFADLKQIIKNAYNEIKFRLKYPEYVYEGYGCPGAFALLKDDKVHYKGFDLYRLKALIDINEDVKAGDLGGFVQSRLNLGHEYKTKCWVYDNARVGGGARINHNAKIKDNAIVWGPVLITNNVVLEGDKRLIKAKETIRELSEAENSSF